MAAEIIGHVKSGSGREYEVKWDSSGHEVYVSYAGWSRCREKANSASHAMHIAEAFLHDK
jgi:hypothetical protein